jgi:hypothetical protein
MTLLLFLSGILLVVSGGVKMHSGARARLGPQPLTLLELLAGGLLCVGASMGLATALLWLVFIPLGPVLVVGSSLHFWSRMSEHRRRRDVTEARRLETYVKYLAQAGTDEDPPDQVR